MSDEMDEIWALYADDGAQALDAAEEALDALNDDPDSAADNIARLFRAIHTFKGNARVLGLQNVETLAHIGEDLIGLVRDEGVSLTQELLDTLVLTNDTLRGMLEETADTHQDVAPEPSAELLDQLRDLHARLSGGSETVDTDAEDSADPQEKPEPETATTPDPAPVATPAVLPAGGLSMDLGNLFDELGDSGGFGDNGDDIFDDAFEEADAEEGEAVAEVDTLAEVIEEPAPLPSLSEDSGYREVFSGMLEETLAALDKAEPDYPDADAVKSACVSVDGLRFAADRLNLSGWVAVLDAFMATPDTIDALQKIVHDLETLRHQQLDGPPPQNTPEDVTSSDQASGDTDTHDTTGDFSPDDGYRQIFLDMVDTARQSIDTITGTWDETSARALRKEADNLLFAADRMGLTNWAETLGAFLNLGAISPDDAIRLNADLGRLRHDLSAQATPQDEEPQPTTADNSFFSRIEPLYSQIAEIGQLFAVGNPPSPEDRAELGDKLATIAEAFGYVRLEDSARALGLATNNDAYRQAELDFYEQLVHVEMTAGYESDISDAIPPSKLLAVWSADQIFETIGELRKGLDPSNQDSDGGWFPMFETLMRRVHYACVHFDVETASQLTMALLDLFARVRADNEKPDIILLQMARGYADTMELVFDALEQGETPDISRIETMFAEAADICFVATGVVTARSVEQRLQLPTEFHRVLSPESVKAAHDGLGENQNFFIIRADLNDDDKMAEGFLEFITSGGLKMITNVTVFLDDGTLFDFLVSGHIEEEAVVERLAMIDPSGDRLSMITALEPLADDDDAAAQGTSDDSVNDLAVATPPEDSTSLAMLEAVGAISASQAMVEHELSKLASEDLMADINNNLRAAGISNLDPRVRNVLRDSIDRHTARLMAVHEIESQLGAQLSALQQESVEKRSRPASALLRPLRAYVAAQSQKSGTPAKLSYVGGDLTLDQLLIEDLRTMLKAMVRNRLSASKAPTEFHVSVEIEADHVRVVFSDNGASIADVSDLAEVQEMARACKGDLRHANLPGSSGVRLLLKVPQHMIVLDGMVVRVGDICYVLPVDAIQRILQTDRVVPISAARDQRMLNMDEDGMVPIRVLQDHPSNAGSKLFVVVSSNDTRLAIPVDELVGQQLVLLRPLEGMLSTVRNMSGVAILSGGEVGMVVAVSQMANAA